MPEDAAATECKGVLERCEEQIARPQTDSRGYRFLRLANGLRVVLVADALADKCAAALQVDVGCLSDPWDIPGLAHFCEHMLFLGTEKYPDENCYNKFLNENSGSSNAYTALDHTKYYFDVKPEALKEALDIFAQFFISPLFTESCVEREVKAVDSEHCKNLQNDNWRMNQISRSCCDDLNHDFAKFGTGSKKTLFDDTKERGVNVRDSLLEFHDKWYSSNLMSLAIVGKESLDELEEMATSLFSGVKNKSVTAATWPDHPFHANKANFTHVTSVKDCFELNMTWPMPDVSSEYRVGADRWVSHLLGHEGPGSLLSYLKKEGLVDSICAGYSAHARGLGFFTLTSSLTEEGVEQVDDVIKAVFQYIQLLQATEPQQWMFDENRDINATEFMYKNKERPISLVNALTSAAMKVPPEDLLNHAYVLSEFSPEKIKALQNALTVDSVKIALLTQKHKDVCIQSEKWYGTNYCQKPLSEDQLKKWRSPEPNPELVLPKPNEFVATDFNLCAEEGASKLPKLIHDDLMAKVWYKQDDYFKLPKSSVSMRVTGTGTYTDPHTANLMHMYREILADNLNEFAYDAELAGINYSVKDAREGITISVYGFSHKQHVVIQAIVDKMLNFTIDTQRFDKIKDLYMRSLKNFVTEQPYQQAVVQNMQLLSHVYWTKQELLDHKDYLTADELKKFSSRFLESVHVEALVHGPIPSGRALELVNIVVEPLRARGVRPVPASMRHNPREHKLPRGSAYCFTEDNSVHEDSCTILLLQGAEVTSTEQNALFELVAQVMQEQAFDELRTKEQLGYIVFSGVRRSCGTQGIRCVVQSTFKPEYLDSRIEAFLHKMEAYIQDMSDEEFGKHRSALVASRLEKPKTQEGLSLRWWVELMQNFCSFDRDAIEAECIGKLTKQQLLEHYKTHVSPTSPHRAKFSCRIRGTANKEGPTENLTPPPPMAEITPVTDVDAFKASLPLFPLPYEAPLARVEGCDGATAKL